jgi:hypothetical protein
MNAYQHFVSTAGIDELWVVAAAIASGLMVLSYALVRVALRKAPDWIKEGGMRR